MSDLKNSKVITARAKLRIETRTFLLRLQPSLRTMGIVALPLLLLLLVGTSPITTLAQEAPPDEPMVVFIHSTNCAVCAKVRPIYVELEREYRDRLRFVSLDVSDPTTLKESRQLAKTLGISSFMSFYEDQFPCIGIFKTKKKLLKELYGFRTKEVYVNCIQKVLEK